MVRHFLVAAAALVIAIAPAGAAELTGKYVEARTCDVYTAPCFANAEMNLAGKHAVIGWRVDKGALDGVKLDGLSVVAVVAASDTLGLKQTGPAKALLIVDDRANAAQKNALVQLVHKQAGDLVRNVIAVERAKVDLEVIPCKDGGCAHLQAG